MQGLECSGLQKVYNGRRVVDGVNFSVRPGEIVGLLGPNGAGKTTSFRMTCGMVTPTAGRVILNGVEVSDWPMYRRAQHGMGYLAQESSVFVKLTVAQNILAVLELLGVRRSDRIKQTDALLEQFGLTKLRQSIASTLSGGERRRLEIARCLASKPSLILLDEPFTGIDPVTIHSIQDIIRSLRDSGIGILLTDHREMETLTITDRSYIICAGRVLVSGDAQTVLNNEDAQKFYFGKRRYHDTDLFSRAKGGAQAAEPSVETMDEPTAHAVPASATTSVPLPTAAGTGGRAKPVGSTTPNSPAAAAPTRGPVVNTYDGPPQVVANRPAAEPARSSPPAPTAATSARTSIPASVSTRLSPNDAALAERLLRGARAGAGGAPTGTPPSAVSPPASQPTLSQPPAPASNRAATATPQAPVPHTTSPQAMVPVTTQAPRPTASPQSHHPTPPAPGTAPRPIGSTATGTPPPGTVPGYWYQTPNGPVFKPLPPASATPPMPSPLPPRTTTGPK